METYIYKPVGVCSREMQITYDGDTLIDLQVIGGCNGNLKGIGKLVKGKKLEEVAKRLEGVTCGMKQTSCPDQLARAIKEILNK
ncbi:MAG: TIGR03905 family TSCPD domain-containing protein [Bacilli bacterium]